MNLDLFEPLSKTITLPTYLFSIKVGGNRVERYFCKMLVANYTIIDADIPGYYQLNSDLKAPFNKILLKKWGGKRTPYPIDTLVLKFKFETKINNLSENTLLAWENIPNSFISLDSISITHSWKNKFQFKEENPLENEPGLRRPQLGALHAISSYLTSDRELEPGTVVLPTGTGKTETMLSAMLYLRCKKILVIVPTKPLRSQIYDKFLSLGHLLKLDVIPGDINYPYVTKLTSGLKSVEEAKMLADASNVIVATASIISSSDQVAVNELCKRCSHLFIDEAHHIAASSWQAIRERFVDRKIIQFTATPFRNDRKALGGRIIYNYTMGEAQRAQFFTHINLIPVEEYYEDSSDYSIARKAIEILRCDLDAGYDHLLMARTNSKTKADVLWKLYQELAPDLNPIVVHSEHSKQAVQTRLNDLLNKKSKIVVCVDMLGEGYDLPNLKIAALHDHHKSLAVTLQFIGRFTRVNHDQRLGEASVIINIADPNVEDDLQHLYSQGADWDLILRRLSENRIEKDVKLQEVIDSLKHKGNLHNQISLWNLMPSFTAILFKANCENWQPDRFEDILPKFEECWHSISDNENLLIILGIQSTPVKWGNYNDLKDTNYKLLLAHWDKNRKALFIFSNDYKVFRVEKLAELLCDNNYELMCGNQIFNIFNGIHYPLARNLGAAQNGSISFTQYFGVNVTDGLSLIEKSQSSLSNIAVLGYEAGEKVIWGCSQKKGKIWSPQKGGTISEWTDWVKSVWDKISSGSPDKENITKNFLRPEKIVQPYNGYPISAQWGEQLLTAYEDRIIFIFGNTEIPFYLVDLTVDGKDEYDCVYIKISSEYAYSIYKLVISSESSKKGYEYKLIDGQELFIKRQDGVAKPLEEYMISDPICIYYVDGAFSYNSYLISTNEKLGQFSKEDLIAIDWTGIDIRKESMGYRKENSIQLKFFHAIENDYDVVINDDGSGEAADIVAFKVINDEILLTLIHCKFSSEDQPGARLKDLYEVCGQAQRSIRWKIMTFNYLYKHIKKREEKLKRDKGYTKFLKGNINDFSSIKNQARTKPIKLQVMIVQPGLSVSKVTDEMLKLLGSTSIFINKTTMADLIVFGSE